MPLAPPPPRLEGCEAPTYRHLIELGLISRVLEHLVSACGISPRFLYACSRDHIYLYEELDLGLNLPRFPRYGRGV